MVKKKQPQEGIIRVRYPRGREVLGILKQRLGGSRTRVVCMDGHTRVCRIPGRLKRRLWVREKDIVLVEPWEFGGDSKGDIVYKYRYNQIPLLREKGLLKEVEDLEEF